MRVLRLQEVEFRRNDRVFRHSRLRALIAWLAGFAGGTECFFEAYAHRWTAGYIFGTFRLLFLLLRSRWSCIHRGNRTKVTSDIRDLIGRIA